MQFKIIPASIKTAPFHVYSSTSSFETGAKINVPMPDPHTAIPVAKDLFLSK